MRGLLLLLLLTSSAYASSLDADGCLSPKLQRIVMERTDVRSFKSRGRFQAAVLTAMSEAQRMNPEEVAATNVIVGWADVPRNTVYILERRFGTWQAKQQMRAAIEAHERKHIRCPGWRHAPMAATGSWR